MNDYGNIKNEELRSSFADFSISKEMQNAVKNEMWRSKYGLWTVLSASCDDAASKCNEYINGFANKLIDVDSCSIRALKSIAESVDLGFLVKDIPNDIPLELQELIDVLSINKSNLLGSSKVVNEAAISGIAGPIFRRQLKNTDPNDLDDFNMNLLYDIKKNVSHLRNILNLNLINDAMTVSLLLKKDTIAMLKNYLVEYIDNLTQIDSFEMNNPKSQPDDFDEAAAMAEAVADLKNRKTAIEDELFEVFDDITLDFILNKIEALSLPELNSFMKKGLFIDGKPALKVDIKNEAGERFFAFGYNELNWFWLIELICKDNAYDEKHDQYITAMYFNKEMNAKVDLTGMFGALLNPILYKSERFIKDFIYFHIFETLKSKLVNKFLFKSFDIQFNRKTGHNTIILTDSSMELTEEEFLNSLRETLNEDDIDEFLNQTYYRTNSEGELILPKATETLKIDKNYSSHFVDFAVYVKFISSIFDKYPIRDESGGKITYDMLRLNLSESKIFKNDRSYYELILGKDGILSKCAKIITDMCLKIANAREAIKAGIQQYALIGTRRIATDIFVEFFLRNFSNRSDWNYISDLSVISNGTLVSGIVKPMSALLNENTKFSIDVIEYYDTGRYLNIKSDMSSVKAGTALKDIGSKVSWYIDQNNLIASAIVSTGIYEDVYQPCSYFVSDYNPRFWEDPLVSIRRRNATTIDDSAIVRFDINDYDKFYSQYDPDLNSISIIVSKPEIGIDSDIDLGISSKPISKADYISSSIKPLLNKIWDTFALSALGENPDTLGELADIYKEYIGSDIGTDKYRNYENVHFPTIAAAIDIDNLVEVSKFDSDILFVAKEYYHNVVEKIRDATIGMLKTLDEHGIPTEGWRQLRTDFHGYSTYYEYANNKSAVSDYPHVRIDVDGPWSYDALKELMFESLDGGIESSIDSIMQNIIDPKVTDIIDENMFSIKDVMSSYLVSDDSIYKIKNNHPACNEYEITKVEYDSSNDYFTLLKKQDEALGIVMFREYCVPLSVPLSLIATNSRISVDSIVKEICNISNECYDFGIVDDLLWMFGKAEGKYKLISFKFWVEYNHVAIDISSYISYSNDINTLNDFVGAVLNENVLTFILFDAYGFMYKLSSRKSAIENSDNDDIGIDDDAMLSNSSIDFSIFKLDVQSNKVSSTTTHTNNALTPMILNDNVPNNNGKKPISFCDNHHIWKSEKFDERCYVAYEALNTEDNPDYFSYYLGFNSSLATFKVYQLEFNENYFYAGKSQSIGTRETLMFSPSMLFSNRYESIILENSSYDNINMKSLNTALAKKLSEYPKCLLKDGKLVIEFLGFTFFRDSSVLYKEYIADKVANRIKQKINRALYDSIEPSAIIFEAEDFEGVLANELSISKTEGDEVIDSIEYTKELKSSINAFKNEPILTSFVNTFAETKQLLTSMPFLKKCMNDELKIICFFKNNTGVNFINDYALDLDLTCYIDDEFERNKKVGYGNKYAKTRYIEWNGDVTKGGYEYLSVDVRKYINERLENRKINDIMKVDLNLCWHDTSELKLDEVIVAVCWDFLREDIPIRLIRTAPKDCKNKVLTLNIDMRTQTLSWMKAKSYPVVKIAYKDTIVATEDGIPDVQVGFINLTEDDINSLDGWESHGYVRNGEFVADFYSYRNDINTFKHSAKEVDFITFILNAPMPDTRIDNVKDYIIALLDDIIRIKTNRLNYVTKRRLGSANYSSLKVADIYFGEEHPVIDAETGIGFIYYGFLNPTYFKELPEYTVKPIDAALTDYRMSYAECHSNSFTQEAMLDFKRNIFNLAPLTDKTIDGFDAYIDASQDSYSIDAYFNFMQAYDQTYYNEALSAIYRDYRLPDYIKSDVKSAIKRTIIGYDTMNDIESYIDAYIEITFKQDLSVQGFYHFMIQYHNEYYSENLQASYGSLNA